LLILSRRRDQGIEIEGHANLVPSTKDAIAFTRTLRQVQRIDLKTETVLFSGVDELKQRKAGSPFN
jgi:hypothetical protein